MANTVTSLVATIPTGTVSPSLHTVNLAIPQGLVQIIRWRVPPGPRGNLGWFLAMGGVQVLPDTNGTVIIADNESDDWQIDGLPDSGAWQLVGYNNGAYDHSVYLEFTVSPIGAATTGAGDILTGFPTSDADIPGMWLT